MNSLEAGNMGKKGKGTASQQRSNYETGNMKVNNKKRTSMRICWSCISCHGCRPCWTLWFCSHGTSYLVLHWLSFFLAWLWIVFVKSNLANRLVKQCEWIKIENSLINALMQLRLRLACFFFITIVTLVVPPTKLSFLSHAQLHEQAVSPLHLQNNS